MDIDALYTATAAETYQQYCLACECWADAREFAPRKDERAWRERVSILRQIWTLKFEDERTRGIENK